MHSLTPALTLSNRISTIQPSPTLALNTKANALKKAGHEVLNFAVGEPDYPTADIVVQKAIESLKAGKTKYTAAGGSLHLREAIAKKLKRDNELHYTPEEIVCGVGAKEILFHAFLALLNEGDEVLLTAPCWVSYCDQIKAAGGVPVVIPVPETITKRTPNANKPDTVGSHPISLETIKKYATPRTKAFVLNTPNNPSGYVLTRTELQELGEFLQTKSWWIVSDEIYEYMAFDRPHVSLLQVCPSLKDRFLLISGMSKGFAMTGWRVGYMAGPSTVVSVVKSLQSHSSTCLPAFIEDAATLALDIGKPLTEKDVQTLRDRRQIAIDTMTRLGGFDFIRPEGAFYIFVNVTPYLKPGESSVQFSQMLLENHYLAMAPGEAFGSPGWIRFSYATDANTLVKGIERLHQAFQQRR